MVIESYGEHNRFQIGFGDFEAAMFLWMGNYGSRHRIILASIVVVPHHIDLIEKNWTKILGNIIFTGSDLYFYELNLEYELKILT